MHRPEVKRGIGLGIVLLCLSGTLVLGIAQKWNCASGDWSDGRQYRQLCYSDIVPLLATEQLQGGRLPFLQACRPTGGQCDEYPVLTMYALRLSAYAIPQGPGYPALSPPLTGHDYLAFFEANAALLALAAFAIAVWLYLLAGGRALYFALAPTLLVYAFMNWDLLAVALATGATLAFRRRRDVLAGVLLGLGAATKLYPALLVVPFALERFRERDPDAGTHMVWAAAGSWIAVNLPFALAAFGSWKRFFTFNASRPADFDSLWYSACHFATHATCPDTTAVNVVSGVLFVSGAVTVWMLKRSRDPTFPRWTFAFPVLVLFLLTSKVYSPQYGLWLLPWFALALPSLWTFVAFEAADIAVFVTRFAWFGRLDSNIHGWVDHVTYHAFAAATLVRAAVLVWCLVAWIRRRPEPWPEVVDRPEAMEPASAGAEAAA